MDDDGSKSLDFQEFQKGLENYGVSVGKDKAQQIFTIMDKDGSGTINFDEFLEKLRVRTDQTNRTVSRIQKCSPIHFQKHIFHANCDASRFISCLCVSRPCRAYANR